MLASRSREEAKLHGPKLPLTVADNVYSTRRNSRRISLNEVQGLSTFRRRGTIHHTGHGVAELLDASSTSYNIIYTSKAAKAYRQRRALHHKHLKKKKGNDSSWEQLQEVQRPIERFRKIARLVIILRTAFKNIVLFASQKGRHEQITSETTLSLRANTAKGTYEDLLFDPEMFKCQFKDSFPSWAKLVAEKPPNKRTDEEVKLLVRLMRQLKGFRRYSPGVQTSFCRVLKYDLFGRRRVIIRKGHIAQRLYFIFSGSVCVTDDEDEDSAFVNTEEERACLKRGDYFGELAFLKNIRRAATIVCLEKTEFLSVSKEDFFETGIDQSFANDLEKRFQFLSHHPLFVSWPRKTLLRLSEVSRVHEYHSDDVIVNNSMESYWIYFITKGHCDVLRLVDLKKCPAYQKHINRQTATTSTAVNNPPKNSIPLDFSMFKTYPIIEEDEEEEEERVGVISCRSDMNIPIHREQTMSSTTITTTTRSKSASVRSKSLPHNFYAPPSARRQSSEGNKNRDKNEPSVGVYMALDRLTPGHLFGAWSIVNEENLNHREREERRLYLLSGGCEVIKMPKKEFCRDSDNETLEQLRILTANYPSDNTLCRTYLKQSQWRCYREELVEDLVERNHAAKEVKTGLRRALVQQTLPLLSPLCSFNPQKPPSSNWEYFRGTGWMAVKAVSPLVKAGQKEKTRSTSTSTPHQPQSSRMTPVLRLTRRGRSSRYPLNAEPLVGEKIVLAKGSHRSLVLTHGGIRCNEFIDEAIPGATA